MFFLVIIVSCLFYLFFFVTDITRLVTRLPHGPPTDCHQTIWRERESLKGYIAPPKGIHQVVSQKKQNSCLEGAMKQFGDERDGPLKYCHQAVSNERIPAYERLPWGTKQFENRANISKDEDHCKILMKQRKDRERVLKHTQWPLRGRYQAEIIAEKKDLKGCLPVPLEGFINRKERSPSRNSQWPIWFLLFIEQLEDIESAKSLIEACSPFILQIKLGLLKFLSN